MNYLKNNLNNSSNLPYDVMKLIYEYADPLFAIRKQIENKEYDLDEIMYQRMKKYMLKTYINDSMFREYMMNHHDEIIIFNESNIHDINFKYAIVNYNCGYKNMFLWRHKRFQSICGLEPNFPNEYNYHLGRFIEINGGSSIDTTTQQLYKEWILLGH